MDIRTTITSFCMSTPVRMNNRTKLKMPNQPGVMEIYANLFVFLKLLSKHPLESVINLKLANHGLKMDSLESIKNNIEVVDIFRVFPILTSLKFSHATRNVNSCHSNGFHIQAMWLDN